MKIMELLKTRRTYRIFDSSKKVDEYTIQCMKQALRYSSCAGNLQNIRYIFVENHEIVSRIFPFTYWAAYLDKEIGTPKPHQQPVMFVIVLKEKGKTTRWTDVDIGIAISNMTLVAWERGVGSCIMGNFDVDKISRILDINEPYYIHSIVAFGIPGHTSTIVDMKDSVKYYIGDDFNYYVPKRKVEDFIKEIKE